MGFTSRSVNAAAAAAAAASATASNTNLGSHHPLKKTVVCKNFALGQVCRFGTKRCGFAHPCPLTGPGGETCGDPGCTLDHLPYEPENRVELGGGGGGSSGSGSGSGSGRGEGGVGRGVGANDPASGSGSSGIGGSGSGSGDGSSSQEIPWGSYDLSRPLRFTDFRDLLTKVLRAQGTRGINTAELGKYLPRRTWSLDAPGVGGGGVCCLIPPRWAQR